MTSIAYFSTDFSEEPILDEAESALQGRQVFRQDQKRISFGGTFYYRGAMPAMELNKHGYDNHLAWRFQTAPDGHIRTLDMNGEWHDPDWFYSQRWMHKDGVEQIRRARAAGQLCFADLDDAFHALPKSNIASVTTDPSNNVDFNRDHYWKMLAECDFVTTSTEPLRKEMERLGVPAFTVRNAIDLERWRPNDPGEDSVPGWIGGIAWRACDLAVLKPSVPAWLRDNNLPFYHGGDSSDPSVPKFWTQMGIDPTRTRCLTAPLVHIAEYTRLWEPIGISLIPLERVRFNEAKSWLKQLESCAAGVPYVVSAGFPEQMLLINEGTAGRVARNEKPQEWYDHLTELLDPEARRKEGAINRSIAEYHNITQRWKDWDDVYSQFK